jgi:Bacterial regulatory proteins, luxR family
MFQPRFTDPGEYAKSRLEVEPSSPDLPNVNKAPSWLRCLLNDVGFGILILDPELKTCFCNDTARSAFVNAGFSSLLESGPSNGKELEGKERVDFKKFIASARLAVKGQRKLILLGHQENQIAAALSPISLGENYDRQGVLITTERKTVCESLSLWAYGRVQGLTSGELKVLDFLATGQEPKLVAKSLKISVTTVRTHIKSILNKTDEPTIRGLLLRIAKLPPIRTLPCALSD